MRKAKLGKKHSLKTREKMSVSHMGNKSNTGRHLPKSQRMKIRKRMTGKRNALGSIRTEEHKAKMRFIFQQDKSVLWKGDQVSYSGLHHWLTKYFGKPSLCENPKCTYPRKLHKRTLLKPKRYEWANISGKYKRERSDYIQLCPSCHRLFDNKKLILCL